MLPAHSAPEGVHEPLLLAAAIFFREGNMDNTTGVPKLMSLHLLEEITDRFSKHRKLGGGAYGDVYLGERKDGVKIAVKVLKDVLDLNDEQFEKEYRNLAILEHKNVVRLVGSCNETKGEYVPHNGRTVFAEKARRMLCFEYMCNGSLDTFIYDESNACNWHTRYGVIKGICEGLEYLHEKLKPDPMCHLDLKPANILLDENMSPKIADFGVSRLFLEEKTKKTNSGLGTLGYIPPEYINGGLISTKFDIFSLGVLIIKIMMGREGYFTIDEMSSQQFADLVHMNWMSRLQGPHAYSIQTRRCIEIALSCVEKDRRKRPSIGVIVSNLNQTEYGIQIFEALKNGLDHQLCPCICNENKMLHILESKSISYPLHVTDNRGRVHEATITTAGNTSTVQQPVKPRIKIIDYTEAVGSITTIDIHSTKPWILVGHYNGNVSIWNHHNQTKVMTFRVKTGLLTFGDKRYIWTAKFVERPMGFVTGDDQGYIHVYSYIKMEKLQKFRGHADCVTSLMWNMDSPTPVASFKCHPGYAHGLDYFCPGGALPYLVTHTKYEGSAQIWDLQSNTCIKHINGLQDERCSVAVVEGPSGRPILLTVSEDNTVAFCDSVTHRYENRVNFNLGDVRDFAYITMTKSIAVLCDNGIAIMEID
nr:probable serine/threonine-protein kinase PBL17 [Lolium perenne]